jgi:thioredoxin-related protein
MRRLITIFAVLAIAVPALAQSPKPATELLAAARAEAKAEGKAVLLSFHASWCGWCKRLGAFLETEAIKPIIERHFVVVWLTTMEAQDKKALENPGADRVLADLGGAEEGIPFTVFMDADGKVLVDSRVEGKAGANIGHPVKPEEVAWFMEMLKKGAPKMTPSETETVKKALLAQKG